MHENVPRVPRPLLGRRLLLERLAATEALTVLHGPAGSGKTTLLVQWAQGLAEPVAWVEPGADGALPHEKLERHAAGSVIVVDRAELLSASAVEGLGRLVDTHHRVRVAVASRSARVAHDVARSCDAPVVLVGPEDLEVTPEELALAAPGMTETEQTALLTASAGSVTAVRAALESGGELVRERLRRRLLDDLAPRPGLRAAVLAMTLVERLDAKVLEAWGFPAQVATEVEDAGLATCDGTMIGLTPLVRVLLSSQAQAELPEAERRRLLAAAVHASLIRTDPVGALRVAFALDDPELATSVTLPNWVELLEQRDATYAVFDDVSASRLRGYPVLVLLLTLLSNMEPSTRARALQLFASESLFQRLQPQRGSHRDRVVYRVAEASALRLTPLADRAQSLVRRAIDDYSALDSGDIDSLGRTGPMLYVHLGISSLYLGDEQSADWCFQMAYAKHQEAGRADAVDPLSMRAGLAALRGELPVARRLLAEADRAEWPPGWRTSSPADFLNLGLAVVAVEDGDMEAAQKHLDAAGPIADLVEHWPFFGYVAARRDLVADQAVVGLMRLQDLQARRGRAPTTSLARSLLDIAEADLRMTLGEMTHARRLATRAAKRSDAGRLVLARVELALGRDSEALARVGRVLVREDLAPRLRLEAELLAAAIALRAGRTADADAALARVGGLLGETGMRSPLALVSVADRRAMADRLEQTGRVAQAALLREDRVAVVPQRAPEALTARELEVLRTLTEAGSVDEVAERLYVSRNTVKSQLRSLYRKLGVGSRDEAISRATALGLLLDAAEDLEG